MELDKTTHEIIKQDSMASIETQGMLGNQYVAISFGSAGQAEVKDGGIIQSEPPLLMADMLKKANGILDSSQQAVQNVTIATAHIASVSTKIDEGDGTVGALVNDKQLYNSLEQTTTTLHDTMLQAQTGVTDFQENMEALKHNFLLSGYFKKRGTRFSRSRSQQNLESSRCAAVKTFTFTAKQLFDARDSANSRIRNRSTPAKLPGSDQFGYAVVVVSSGMDGDSKKSLILTEARAMVIRETWLRTLA